MCPQALMEKDTKQNTDQQNILQDWQTEINEIKNLPRFKNALNKYLGHIEDMEKKSKKDKEEEIKNCRSTLRGVLKIYQNLQDKVKNGELNQLQLESLDKTLENMLIIGGYDIQGNEYAIGYRNLGDVYFNNYEKIADILEKLAKKNIDPETIKEFMLELQNRLELINLDVINYRTLGDNKEVMDITNYIGKGLKNLAEDIDKDRGLFDESRGLIIDPLEASKGNIVVIRPVLNFYSLGQRPGGISWADIFQHPDYFIPNRIGDLSLPNLTNYGSLLGNTTWLYPPTAQFLSTYDRYYKGMGGGVVILSKPQLSPFLLAAHRELFNYIALIEKNLPLRKKEKEQEINKTLQGSGSDTAGILTGAYREGYNKIIAGGIAYNEERKQLAALILNTVIENINTNINELFVYGTQTENTKKFQTSGIDYTESMLEEINLSTYIGRDMTVEKLNTYALPVSFAKITIESEDKIVILPHVMYEEQNANDGKMKITDAGLYVVKGDDVYHIALKKEKIDQLNNELKNNNEFAEIIKNLGNGVTLGGGAQYKTPPDEKEKYGGYFIAAIPYVAVGAASDGNITQGLAGLKFNESNASLFIGGGRFVPTQETTFGTIDPTDFLWAIFRHDDYAFGAHVDVDSSFKKVQGGAGRFEGKVFGATVDTFLYVKNNSGTFDLYFETPNGFGLFVDVRKTEDGKISGNFILDNIHINDDMDITLIGNSPPLFSMSNRDYFKSNLLNLEGTLQELATEDKSENKRRLLNEINSRIYYLTSGINFFGFSSYPLGSIIINHKKYGRLTIGYSPTLTNLDNKPSAIVSYTSPKGATLTLAGQKGDNWAISAGANNIWSLKISGSEHGNIRADVGTRLDSILDSIFTLSEIFGVGGSYWHKWDPLNDQRGLGLNVYYQTADYGTEKKFAVAYTNIRETRYTKDNYNIEGVSSLQTLSLAFGHNPNKNSNITTGLNIFNINEHYGGGVDLGVQYNILDQESRKNFIISGKVNLNYAQSKLSYLFTVGVQLYIPAPPPAPNNQLK